MTGHGRRQGCRGGRVLPWQPREIAVTAAYCPVSDKSAANNPMITGSDAGRGANPQALTASATPLSQLPQRRSSIRWQADCGAQGRQPRAPQSARQLLFLPQPVDTVSDKQAAHRESN